MGCVEGRIKKIDDGSNGWRDGPVKIYVNNSIRPICVLRMAVEDDAKENQQSEKYSSYSKGSNEDKIEGKKSEPKFTAEQLTKFDGIVTCKYRFLRLIGTGRFSCVWLAENKLNKIPYAMKMTAGAEGREIFNSELQILNRVRHPNIVQLIETFEKDNRFYIVSELATGGDLFDRTESQPGGCFSEPDAAKIIYMITDGLQYLHNLGITHRDLKLDNLLFYHPGPDSKILITDFAVAHLRKSGGSKYMTAACGTPEYIAPEILLHQQYTSAVDLWSLGVVTYCILSGSFPFTSEDSDPENNNQMYLRILKSDYSFTDEIWENVSELCITFIKSLLNPKSKERLTAAEAFRHSWLKKHSTSSLSSSEEMGEGNVSSSVKYLHGRDPELSKLKQCIIAHQKNMRF